jgi:hypothetical protein
MVCNDQTGRRVRPECRTAPLHTMQGSAALVSETMEGESTHDGS